MIEKEEKEMMVKVAEISIVEEKDQKVEVLDVLLQKIEKRKIFQFKNAEDKCQFLQLHLNFLIPEEEEQYGEFELVDPLSYTKGLSIDDFELLILCCRG
jgi:hypothetical protein